MKTLTLILLCLALAAQAQLNQMTLVGEYYGEAAENIFGQRTTAGDFDNDGKEEFIIGAPGWNNYMGKSYFYDWNGSWPTAPIWTPHGAIEGIMYDLDDQNLGDINGDGLQDFSMQLLDAIGWGGLGRLDIYFGSNGLDTLPDWSMWSGDSVFAFGMNLDSCGDVNGDEAKDFLMNTWYVEGGFAVFQIYFGGQALDSIPDWTYPTLTYQYCSALGDVNGDGYGDILILSANEDPVKLFFGGSPMDTVPDLIFYDWAFNGIGEGVGDVNGDSCNDFCISLKIPDTLAAYDQIYFGGPDVDNGADAILQDRFGEPDFSSHGMGSGDFNGDGYSDIASGGGDIYWGNVVYIYLGGPWFNGVPDAVVSDYSIYFDFGKTISSGDINGDGRDELLVSAVNYGWFTYGKVYLYTGPETWIDYGAAVDPEELPRVPGWFKLDQNYPNPFNASTSIHFELGKPSTVNLKIYDFRGNEIKQLIANKEMLPGGYNVSWNGKNEQNQQVSSGIYLLALQVDQFRQLRKIALLR